MRKIIGILFSVSSLIPVLFGSCQLYLYFSTPILWDKDNNMYYFIDNLLIAGIFFIIALILLIWGYCLIVYPKRKKKED